MFSSRHSSGEGRAFLPGCAPVLQRMTARPRCQYAFLLPSPPTIASSSHHTPGSETRVFWRASGCPAPDTLIGTWVFVDGIVQTSVFHDAHDLAGVHAGGASPRGQGYPVRRERQRKLKIGIKKTIKPHENVQHVPVDKRRSQRVKRKPQCLQVLRMLCGEIRHSERKGRDDK